MKNIKRPNISLAILFFFLSIIQIYFSFFDLTLSLNNIILTMNFKQLFAILAYSATATNAVPLTESNSLCSAQQFGEDFSGIIVQDQKTMDYPPQNHMRITRCVDGEQRAFDAYLPLDKSLNLPWGRKICTGQKNEKATCYIMARRETTFRRSISIYQPGEWVGGIFLCPGHLMDDGIKCTNKNAVPLWPLVASNLTHFEEHVRATSLIRVPLLMTYNIDGENPFELEKEIPDEWAKSIDIHEKYAGIQSSRSIKVKTNDLIMNTLNKFYSLGQVFFTMPSSTTSTDHGDLRPRRSARRLIEKVPFESQPDYFLPAPKMSYLDYATFNKKGIKKIKEELGIMSVSEEQEAHNPELGFQYKVKVNSETEPEVEIESTNEADTEHESNENAVEFSLGELVGRMASDPEFSKAVQDVISANSIFGSKKGIAEFSHAYTPENPSELLDSINLKTYY